MATRGSRAPRLPDLLVQKFQKTGMTRGATDAEVYQNRVSRTSTVLIPLAYWAACRGQNYTYGFIVLIPPSVYFSWANPAEHLAQEGLALGQNALVFYETRQDWTNHNPTTLGWSPGTQRLSPLGGQYIARIPATTAGVNGGKISEGYNTTSMKGAGIRVYEYASADDIAQCRLQLEAVFWHCFDAEAVVVAAGMDAAAAVERRGAVMEACAATDLLDYSRLRQARIVNSAHEAVCPLCLERLSAQIFMERMAQASGRETLDLTTTQVSLFHIAELRVGAFNHRPYNLGWGHHHCNVVVKDAGIAETLAWMTQVVDRNLAEGLTTRPLPQTMAAQPAA